MMHHHRHYQHYSTLCMSVCMCVCVCLYVCLSVCLSICLSVCLCRPDGYTYHEFRAQFVLFSIYLSKSVSVSVSVSLSVFLSVSVCEFCAQFIVFSIYLSKASSTLGNYSHQNFWQLYNVKHRIVADYSRYCPASPRRTCPTTANSSRT